MAAFLNVCRFNPTAGTTTDWTYSSAVTGYQSPSAAGVVNGRAYKYRAESADLSQWEIGEGTYNAGTGVLSRTTIIANSAGTTSKINFSAAPQVAIVALKEDLISVEEANAFTPAQKAQALSNIGGVSSGFVNKFRNGTMDIWHRGTSITPPTSTNDARYYADGWIVGFTASSPAAITVSRALSLLNAYYAMVVAGATNITGVTTKQRIEGIIAAPLRAQQVTVQARVFNNTGGAITPTLTVKTPTAQDNYASTTTDINAVSLQPCANNAWTVIAYTFTASGTAYNGQEITFDFGNNFGASAKSIQISELDIRATPGIATGLNNAPPGPEMRPISVESSFCQRYFFSAYPNGTAPGTAIGGGAAGFSGYGNQASSGGFAFFAITVQFPEMRSVGTVTFYDNAGTAGKVSYYTGSWSNGGTGLFGASGVGWANIGINNIAGTFGLSFMFIVSAEL